VFCFDCIRKWSEHENTCPLCKKRFKAIDRIRMDGDTEAGTGSTGKRKRKAKAPAGSGSTTLKVSRRNQTEGDAEGDGDSAFGHLGGPGGSSGFAAYLNHLGMGMSGQLDILWESAARTSAIHEVYCLRNRKWKCLQKFSHRVSSHCHRRSYATESE